MSYTAFTTLLILYFILHSLLAGRKAKQFLTTRLIPEQYYRICYNLFATGTLLALAYYYLKLEELPVFNYGWPLRVFGLLVLFSGLLIILKALKKYDLLEFSGLDRRSPLSGAGVRLQTDGLHRIVRHPLYLGILMMAWGFFFYQADYKSLLLATLFTIYLLIGIELEEKRLIEEHGATYLRYMEQVPRLLPW